MPRESIRPNEYNPNAQAPPEHKLLRISILTDGWTQPIVVHDDGTGEKPVIVDGEHRWRVSADPEVSAKTDGLIPIVRVKGTPSSLMMSTVRHNRARGEHGILPMSRIVRELIEAGNDVQDICFLMQMEPEEVLRLGERAGLPEITGRMREAFSSGWIPGG